MADAHAPAIHEIRCHTLGQTHQARTLTMLIANDCMSGL